MIGEISIESWLVLGLPALAIIASTIAWIQAR